MAVSPKGLTAIHIGRRIPSRSSSWTIPAAFGIIHPSPNPDTSFQMKNIILDCDPGYDDAVALLLAAGSPEIRHD